MEHYIIDGNNFIGKINYLREIFTVNKQKAREELVILLNSYFNEKKGKVSLYFDGYENLPLGIVRGKIYYSKNKPADTLIRDEIDRSSCKRLIKLITSDLSLAEYGKVNSCKVIPCEEFYYTITKEFNEDEEEKKIRELPKQKDYWEKIFKGN
ncbi:MAG: NYN domain-containing protein [Melioribacter sp.]|nr:NYN domain-containing protein [Melioribacter sp.]